MSYKHGAYVREVPTSLIPMSESMAGLPVVLGTAPIHLAKNQAAINKPILCYTYKEAVEQLGYHEDWNKYTLCEFMKSHFTLFNVAPVVFINILDPVEHKEEVSVPKEVGIENREGILAVDGILLESIKVQSESDQDLTLGKDYDLAFNNEGDVVFSILSESVKRSIKVVYTRITPEAIDAEDIIGGISLSGKITGLELVNEILPRFRLIPGQIVVPKFSSDPSVAAVMGAKASNINGFFKCIYLTDVPVDSCENYTQVAEWKNTNNYIHENQVVCWPKVRMGDDIYHMSTQLAGLICKTDAYFDGVPYVSPSNRNLQINGLVGKEGEEVTLGIDQANALNGQGIITAINFSGGWKAWGNRTAIYPSNTDTKDAFLCIKRMFYYVAATIIQTFWSKVDGPITPRLVDTIMDSLNIWLNGMTASEYILGGRVIFLEEENSATDIMDGILKFHVYLTPPSPAKELDFVLEYDPGYLSNLFN